MGFVSFNRDDLFTRYGVMGVAMTKEKKEELRFYLREIAYDITLTLIALDILAIVWMLTR